MSTETKNIHLAEPLLAELEGVARSEQKSPDELADEAVRAFLRKRRWQDVLTTESRKVLKAESLRKTCQKPFISGVATSASRAGRLSG
jgi:metal-responsive CopG/Arc/MetJ family transcriptional regulator